MATSQVVQTSSLPTKFEPFYTGTVSYKDAAGKTQTSQGLIPQAFSLFGQGTPAAFKAEYVDPLKAAGLYGESRVAGLTPTQLSLQKQITGLQTPTQFAAGTKATQEGIAGLAGLTDFSAANVTAPQLTRYQMGPADTVIGQQYMTPEMVAAQSGYAPQLTAFQMQAAPDVTAQQFTREIAQQYMSPYQQSVTDVAKRMALEDAQRAQLAGNLAAGRKGTLGASGELLASTERERALQTQLGDIQARGLQAAYEQAAQQFERDRGASLQAQLANQQAAQQAAMQNLQSQLGVQQLGTQTGLQTALANLDKAQQAAVQNQAAALQTQGLNADQALRAALANQQAGLTVGQQNLQALLGVQQLGAGQSLEAQRANQDAAIRAAEQQRLAALGLGSLGQQMGQMGVAQQAAELDRLKTLGAFGDLERALAQQKIDARYADVMRGIQYPEEQLAKLSGFIRGVPLTDVTQTTTTPPPSFASQLAGLGLSGLGMYNLLGGTK